MSSPRFQPNDVVCPVGLWHIPGLGERGVVLRQPTADGMCEVHFEGVGYPLIVHEQNLMSPVQLEATRQSRTDLESAYIELQRLKAAVKEVVTQQADDLCWMDVYVKLGALVGVPFDPKALPRATMLGNCERYVDSLLAGSPYAQDKLTAVANDYEAAKAALRGAGVAGVTLAASVRALLRSAEEAAARHDLEED
jgi:hypothetical protein